MVRTLFPVQGYLLVLRWTLKFGAVRLGTRFVISQVIHMKPSQNPSVPGLGGSTSLS
jgi:hypothetical protein